MDSTLQQLRAVCAASARLLLFSSYLSLRTALVKLHEHAGEYDVSDALISGCIPTGVPVDGQG